MSFLTNIFKKKVEEIPVNLLPRLTNSYTLFDANNIEQIFKTIAYPCMKYRADAISTIELIYKQGDNILDNTHWLSQLFNSPNPYYSQNEILKLIQYWLDINGNCFLYLPKYNTLLPQQIWILNPTKVRIRMNEGSIIAYDYTTSQTLTILPDEIIHLRNLLPTSNQQNEMLGTGTAQLALSNIISESELNKYMYRFLSNDAMPPAILESPTDIGEDSWQMFQQTWNAKLPNHKLLGMLHSGMKVVPLNSQGVTGTSIGIKDLNEVLLNKISMFFGVPYSKLTGQNTSYSSAIVSDWTFKTDTIKPLIVDMIQKLNVYFKKFDKTLSIDYKDFEYFDQEFKLKETQLYLNTGVLTPNEVRQTLGLEPLMVQPTPILPVLTPQTTSKTLLTKDLSNHTEEQIVEFWSSKSLLIDKLNKNLSKPISNVFKELEDIILSNWYKVHKSGPSDNLFSDSEFNQLLTNELTDTLILNYKTSMKDASININVEFNEDVFKNNIKQYVKESINNIKIVGQSVKNSIERILTNNIDASVNEMADLISEELSQYQIPGSQWKGQRIAETTNTYVVNKSSQVIYNQNGIVYKWITRRDGKVRDSHLALDGKKVSRDGTFEIKNSDGSIDTIEFPGQGLPENIINCRCVLMPV